MDNVTKKIISNFQKGLITESDMIRQLYYADKDAYCQYLNKMYSKERDSISEGCLVIDPCTGDCEWIEDD